MRTQKSKTKETQSDLSNTLYVCSCCRRTLPATEFYINPTSGYRDFYCKVCRSNNSRLHRIKRICSQEGNKRASYPLLTDSQEDLQTRLKMLRHALQVVRQKVEHKKELLKQQEYDAFR